MTTTGRHQHVTITGFWISSNAQGTSVRGPDDQTLTSVLRSTRRGSLAAMPTAVISVDVAKPTTAHELDPQIV